MNITFKTLCGCSKVVQMELPAEYQYIDISLLPSKKPSVYAPDSEWTDLEWINLAFRRFTLVSLSMPDNTAVYKEVGE